MRRTAGTYFNKLLETLLRQRVEAGKLVLPNLSAFANQSLGIFSDYSGEGSGNRMTYSILVCGYGYTSVFADKVKHVRKKPSVGEREIAYKDFGFEPLWAALPDYLAAANELPGLLCTVAVDICDKRSESNRRTATRSIRNP